MSKLHEVNNNFPNYVNYHLHRNNIDNFSLYTLQYKTGEYKFTHWNYAIQQPSLSILKTYKLHDVNALTVAIRNANTLKRATVPLRVTTHEQTILTTLGTYPDGSLVYNVDKKILYMWIGSGWKEVC